MRDWKMSHKNTVLENAGMEKREKEKYGKIIIWHYAYRMHELNNATKDASCQFISSRVST